VNHSERTAAQGVSVLASTSIGLRAVLREWYGDKIVDRWKPLQARRIHPMDMNALGGLRLALMRQKQSA
jgi:hypothetical protein